MIVNCKTCLNPFVKSDSDIKRTKNHFCSRSCAAKFNNKIPKRKIQTKTCKNCKIIWIPLTWKEQTKLCQKCRKNKIDYKNMTLKEYHDKLSIINKHPSWKNAQIRNFNRSWNKTITKKPCINCGYKLHVELAHIKAIVSFPETAKLGVVNSPENIVPLCRNCHWEFDHGILKINPLS